MSLRFPKPEKRAKEPKPLQKGSRPRRKRKGPLAAAERTLWKAFARYVKDRDGPVCFSCGAVGLEGHSWHAGHMFSADRFAVIRYHPLNVHSQCARCNKWLHGNEAEYVSRFLEVYGIGQLDYISSIRRQPMQWKEHDIRELIEALKKGGADYEMLYAEKIGSVCTCRGGLLDR